VILQKDSVIVAHLSMKLVMEPKPGKCLTTIEQDTQGQVATSELLKGEWSWMQLCGQL
jgi:hypothetical protein